MYHHYALLLSMQVLSTRSMSRKRKSRKSHSDAPDPGSPGFRPVNQSLMHYQGSSYHPLSTQAQSCHVSSRMRGNGSIMTMHETPNEKEGLNVLHSPWAHIESRRRNALPAWPAIMRLKKRSTVHVRADMQAPDFCQVTSGYTLYGVLYGLCRVR
jgi:hypothetical protein